jgi:phage shock protein C
MTKKLYRSRSNRMLAGVCGGLADYFGIDPTIVRILMVLFALAGGPGLILYIVLLLIIPESPY